MGALGYRRYGRHKKKASRGHLGSCRTGFGPYGRGNLPGHHVFGGLAKVVCMGAGAHIAVWMGADGCRGKGKGKKQRKRTPNGSERDVLWGMHTV